MLENIQSPRDLQKLSMQELEMLAEEIRSVLIPVVSDRGGHLASNLGVVELTLALHRAFEAPKDKIIFDVGHQAYVHKLITGRYQKFFELRQKDGLSGFPRIAESEYDAFCVGHASTAISAAVGMARAFKMRGEDRFAVAVVGDGALTGGMCYEALNDAGNSELPLIVILNDNEMSISPNVGALSGYLTNLRQSGVYRSVKRFIRRLLLKVPIVGMPLEKMLRRLRDALKAALVDGQFFDALGMEYYGPIDGHDIARMITMFEHAQKQGKPALLHVITQKGKGYAPAENRPDKFHGVAPFYVEKADGLSESGKIAGKYLTECAQTDERISVITAAMPVGTGMSVFQKQYPERFFDVGIAEEHAVTMASGMALGGMKPYVCIYSTFLQRAYDQIMMDAAMNRAGVVFLLDRAGLTGPDGETHQGVFDLSYLSQIPGMVVCSPRNEGDLKRLIDLSLKYEGPMAIRYSKECLKGGGEKELQIGEWEEICPGDDIAILAAGRMADIAVETAKLLAQNGISAQVTDARFIKPMDEIKLAELGKKHSLIVTLEDNTLIGGFGSAVMEFFAAKDMDTKVLPLGIPDAFLPQASVSQQLEMAGLTPERIAQKIIARWKNDARR